MKLTSSDIRKLEELYSKYWWSEEDEKEYRKISSDAFKLLIFTILSQNTSGTNTRRAYAGLARKFNVTPETLAIAAEEEIAEAIRPGGLHRMKARKIKRVSQYIMEKYGGNMEMLLKGNKAEIKQKLMELPGVGNKTADVLISSMHGQKKALVIDTHMKRIARRLGLVKENAKYEEIQKALKKFFHGVKYREKKIESLPYSGFLPNIHAGL